MATFLLLVSLPLVSFFTSPLVFASAAFVIVAVPPLATYVASVAFKVVVVVVASLKPSVPYVKDVIIARSPLPFMLTCAVV